mgnify:CR=1 FL=1
MVDRYDRGSNHKGSSGITACLSNHIHRPIKPIPVLPAILPTALARLESKQQALIFGHAMPMPLVIHTREYGSSESYAQLVNRAPGRRSQQGMETTEERPEREIAELF